MQTGAEPVDTEPVDTELVDTGRLIRSVLALAGTNERYQLCSRALSKGWTTHPSRVGVVTREPEAVMRQIRFVKLRRKERQEGLDLRTPAGKALPY